MIMSWHRTGLRLLRHNGNCRNEIANRAIKQGTLRQNKAYLSINCRQLPQRNREQSTLMHTYNKNKAYTNKAYLKNKAYTNKAYLSINCSAITATKKRYIQVQGKTSFSILRTRNRSRPPTPYATIYGNISKP
jgi:hypothetical protein